MVFIIADDEQQNRLMEKVLPVEPLNAERTFLSYLRQGIILFLSSLSIILLTSQISDKVTPRGEYLGMQLPGDTPERFAAGIIPDDLHSSPVFSLDGKNLYYKTLDGKGIMCISRNADRWLPAKPVMVNNETENSDDPCISPKDGRLWFTSYNKEKNREFIYYCNKLSTTSCQTIQPDGQLNTLDLHWQFSLAANGNVYFSANGSIYCSECINGAYAEPYKLDEHINTELSECTPYISPDESLLLFARGNNGKPDLYVSRRLANGQWSESVALSNGINSEHHEMCPQITPDGKYLFFLSSRQGLFSAYWVSTRHIFDAAGS